MVLTAQPVQNEPQSATRVLSTTTGVAVAEAPVGVISPPSVLGRASKLVELCNSPSSMPSLSISLTTER